MPARGARFHLEACNLEAGRAEGEAAREPLPRGHGLMIRGLDVCTVRVRLIEIGAIETSAGNWPEKLARIRNRGWLGRRECADG